MQKTQDRTGKIEQLETFVAVAEHGTIAAAAKVLGKDPSVLSRRVDALESRLGVRLLTRTTRKVALTDAGIIYLEKVRSILADLAAADVDAADGAARPRGLVRMTMPTTFARNRVVPWLPGFLDQYPDLEVELLVGDRYADLVEENIDLAIRIGHLTSSSLKVRHLASFETILCASPGYLGKHGIPRTLDDLRQHPCLGLNQPQVWPDWHLRCGDRTATVRVSGKLRFDDGGTMVEAGLNGGGILLVSQWSIGRYLADGRLVRLLPEWRMEHDGTAQIVLPPGRLVPAKTRILVDRLVEEFTHGPPWAKPSAYRLAADDRTRGALLQGTQTFRPS